MKKIILLSYFFAIGCIAKAQTADRPWSIGIEGGGQQYNGQYGDGFYNSSHGLWGFGGISLYHFLTPHLDFGGIASMGGVGYKDNGATPFFNTIYQVNANFRFSFFKYEKVRLRPFLMLGFGDIYFSGANSNTNTGANYDIITIPDFGFGLTYKVSPSFNIKLQELFVYPLRSITLNEVQDGYLLHSIGIVYIPGHMKDADHDGVADSRDLCPGTPAGVQVDKKGCPLDRDGDGIPDYQDDCPDVKGTAAARGCPDSDGDGVADKNDKCPGTPAGVAVDANGCPLDRDGDGIPDYQDECPDAKGTAALKGCPDSDGDGVADKNDKCPGTPAGVQVDGNGCPLDRDGDGVPDYQDACPDVKGLAENKGCPAVKTEVKELFTKAIKGITFETGKDVIKKSSFGILNKVVSVMNENPTYNLQINGYTDNKGKAEANQLLSEKRANAVKAFLVAKGINESRLKTAGFGGEHPIDSNNTEEGRKNNRRVELIVNF